MNFFKKLAYAPLYTQLVVTRRCNLSCAYCNEFDKTSEPVPLDILKERVKKIKSLGALSLGFTGGETTMHPQLPELIHYAIHDVKILRVSIITNGFYLTPEYIEKLNLAGLHDLQISIDGVEANDQTVKVLQVLQPKLEALRLHAKFNVIVSAVLGVCPPAETLEVITAAKKMGFRPRVLLVHDEDGQLKLNDEQLKIYQDIKKMTQRHLYEISSYRDQMIKKGKAAFKCRAGSRYLYIDEFGSVFWCSQSKNLFQKKLEEYSFQDLKQQFYTPKPCQETCTVGCARSASAYDKWRSQRLNQKFVFSGISS